MAVPFIKMLMRSSNMFSFDEFWNSNGHRSYSSVCGGLVSIPLLVIIVILFILKIIQMATYGIVLTNTQLHYFSEPPVTTFSTFQNDSTYAPFMIAFSVNIDSTSCPNSALSFEVLSLEMKGDPSSPNRTTSKIPLNF